jgi:hypothetical protein
VAASLRQHPHARGVFHDGQDHRLWPACSDCAGAIAGALFSFLLTLLVLFSVFAAAQASRDPLFLFYVRLLICFSSFFRRACALIVNRWYPIRTSASAGISVLSLSRPATGLCIGVPRWCGLFAWTVVCWYGLESHHRLSRSADLSWALISLNIGPLQTTTS